MPLEFADCVRVSLVASETRVTLVSVSAPPEESVTVPVIPPSVCCAKEYGENARVPRTKKRAEKKKKFRLLIIRNVTPEIQRDRGVGTDFFITRPISSELKAGHRGQSGVVRNRKTGKSKSDAAEADKRLQEK